MRRLWLIALLGVWAGIGWAQQATITAVVRVVEHQRTGTAQWLASKVGTTLESGDRVRTGKRSYAEVSFADKSVVKLNELSELTVHSSPLGSKRWNLSRQPLGSFRQGLSSDYQSQNNCSSRSRDGNSHRYLT